MGRILYIQSSPRKNRSISTMIAMEFLSVYQEKNPDDTVYTLDLWESPLPELSGDTIRAKYRIIYGQEHTMVEMDAWKPVVDLFARFNCADKYLFTVPMWNFGMPYKLKQFMDLVVQPGLAYSYAREAGFTGLVTGKPAVVIYTRGDRYLDDEKQKILDFQIPHFEAILNFIGIHNIESIVVEPTVDRPDNLDKTLSLARKRAGELASRF